MRFSGDELFHAQSAVYPGRALTALSVDNLPANIAHYLADMPFKQITSIAQFALVITIVFLLCRVLKRGTLLQIVFFTASLMLFYSVIAYGYKYPSGYILMQFFASSIWNDQFGFRFAQVLLLTLAIVVATRNFQKSVGITRYLLIFICLLQIPVITYTIAVIDQAVYFAFLAGIILWYSIGEKLEYQEKLEFLASAIAILVFCRSSALLLIPVTFFPLYLKFRDVKVFKFTTPLLAVMPILFVSTIELLRGLTAGSPTTDVSAYSESNAIMALWNSILTQFDLFSLIVLLLAVSFSLITKKTRLLTILYLGLISTVFAYGIPITVRGHNKYALEAFLPIIILALLALFDSLGKKSFTSNYQKILVPIFLIFAIVSSTRIDFTNLEKDLDDWGQSFPLINYPIQINVEEYLEEKRLDSVCKNLGSTYGFYNYIQNGRTYNELLELEKSQLVDPITLDWGKGVIQDLDLSDYKCVVLDNYPAKSEIREVLKSQGFELIYQEKGSYFPTVSEIWQKVR
jgi:hypothetical protein